MKIYEHLPEALAQAAVKFVREYQSRNFVREVIREIHQSETAFENSTPKACSHFLIEIAKLDSEIILPSMSVLLPELESDVSACGKVFFFYFCICALRTFNIYSSHT